MGALAVELHAGRAGHAQRVGELGVEARGAAELAEQELARVVEPAPQRPGVAPDRLGGDPQARVLRRLQRELQPPPRLALDRVAQVVDGDLGQPERAAGGPGVRGADDLPPCEPGVEGAGRRGVEQVLRHGLVREAVPGLGVDERREGLGHDVRGVRSGPVAQRATVECLGADRGRERRGECVRSDEIGTLQDRAPAEGVLLVLRVGGREDASAGHEVGGETAQYPQELELRALTGERLRVQERAGVELEDGHGPGGERCGCCQRCVVADTGRPSLRVLAERGRGVRHPVGGVRSAGRGQVQHRLPLGAGRREGRRDGAQLRVVGRERVRARPPRAARAVRGARRVLGPEADPPARGPRGVQREHDQLPLARLATSVPRRSAGPVRRTAPGRSPRASRWASAPSPPGPS